LVQPIPSASLSLTGCISCPLLRSIRSPLCLLLLGVFIQTAISPVSAGKAEPSVYTESLRSCLVLKRRLPSVASGCTQAPPFATPSLDPDYSAMEAPLAPTIGRFPTQLGPEHSPMQYPDMQFDQEVVSPLQLPPSLMNQNPDQKIQPPAESQASRPQSLGDLNPELLRSFKFSYFVSNVVHQVVGKRRVGDQWIPIQALPPTFNETTRLIATVLAKISDHIPASVIVISLVLLERLIESQRFILQFGCEYKMFIGCLVIAHKLHDDRAWGNKAWSGFSGLDARKISDKERQFLAVLQYQLFVGPAVYQHWETYFGCNAFYCSL
ncbi:uncharacterized protein BJ171DRAFT_619748, partial [Polychytrium aggregatum]|uniref:uncharacterized protein n=1 Tax=Polychytrium aggregatum TaxID=110093 RepID=UPI0022FE5691